MLNQCNTNKQGNVGLGSAIAYFTSKGLSVSIPLTDTQDYDLIIEYPSGLKKVQVKTTRNIPTKSPYYTVELRTRTMCNGIMTREKNFADSDCDLLYILCADGSTYLIPRDQVATKFTMSLGKKYQSFRI